VLDPNVRGEIVCQIDTLRGYLTLEMSAPSVSPTAPPRPEERGNSDAAPSPLLEISTETVRVYRQAFGRGPTKARTRS